MPPDEIIRTAIFTALQKLRVHLPCQIIKVRGNQLVDVQPTIQTRYKDGTVVNLPPIQNVTVKMPMGVGWSIKFPIKVGDTGDLIFSDRSLQNWAAGDGGIVDPQDDRMHDLTDAVFTPGMPTVSQQTTDQTTDLVITNGQSQVRFLSNGGFEVYNNDSGQQILVDGTSIKLVNGDVTVEADQTSAKLTNGTTTVEVDVETIKIANATTTLGTILTQLMTELTAVGAALSGNPSTEPAAAAGGAALDAAAIAIQLLITELLT
jgi:hypothetical protein